MICFVASVSSLSYKNTPEYKKSFGMVGVTSIKNRSGWSVSRVSKIVRDGRCYLAGYVPGRWLTVFLQSTSIMCVPFQPATPPRFEANDILQRNLV